MQVTSMVPAVPPTTLRLRGGGAPTTTRMTATTASDPTAKNKKIRIQAFDSMRFFLIVNIVLGHFIMFAKPSPVILKFFSQHNVLVGAFFALSGYVTVRGVLCVMTAFFDFMRCMLTKLLLLFPPISSGVYDDGERTACRITESFGNTKAKVDPIQNLWLLSLAFGYALAIFARLFIQRCPLQWMAHGYLAWPHVGYPDTVLVPHARRNLECPDLVPLGIDLCHGHLAFLLTGYCCTRYGAVGKNRMVGLYGISLAETRLRV
jgi:hypothetical protein